MNYYYDVILNFQDRYYMFYEWDKNDYLDYVRKIPLILIDSSVLQKIYCNKIKVDKELLNRIDGKTKLKKKELRFAVIFTDGKSSIGVEFNETGESVFKSSLQLDDELNINEFVFGEIKEDIKYEIIDKEKYIKILRKDEIVRKTIKKEIDYLFENDNKDKIKYLYLEWFSKYNDDLIKVKGEMMKKINNNIGEDEYKIYEIIKNTYDNV